MNIGNNAMKHFKFALAAVAILLTGCWQKSIHPFYKASQVIWEEKLVGSFKAEDDDTSWKFEKGDAEKVYRFKVVDKETTIDCDGRLFKMGEQLYFDAHSRARSVADAPAHCLFRIREIGSMLKMDALNLNWVRQWAEKRPGDIAGVMVVNPEHRDDPEKSEFILTAETDRLQKFIETHQHEEGFWDAVKDLKKQ